MEVGVWVAAGSLVGMAVGVDVGVGVSLTLGVTGPNISPSLLSSGAS